MRWEMELFYILIVFSKYLHYHVMILISYTTALALSLSLSHSRYFSLSFFYQKLN